MRQFVLVFVLTFATLAALPTSESQVVPEGTLSGMVCQSSWGECWQGIPDAVVTLTQPGAASPLDASHQQTTGPEGRFEFSGLDGDYSVTVERQGFDGYEGTITVDGATYSDFQITGQNVTVAGQITGPDGTGVPAYIELWSERDYREAKTDESGAFSFEVIAGWGHLNIRSNGLARYEQQTLLDGSPLNVELKEAPAADATVRGVVRDQDGNPVAEAQVYGYQWQAYEYGAGDQWATTGPDGSYELQAYNGDINLNVEKEGYRSAYAYLYVEGQDITHDFEILKFPEKTAEIRGKLVDAVTGDPLRFASISIQTPEYGIYECSDYASNASSDSGDVEEPRPMSPSGTSIAYPEPYYRGCAVTLHEDGTFTGMVTPGYSIVSIWYDHYRTCSETSSSDGSYSRTCGQDYLGWAGTLVLEEGSNEMTIELKPRAKPDAVVSGYIVDTTTQKAIPGARISFSSEESYGWADASTDGDGSYKVRLLSGYQRVNIWAEGYLPWQGVLDIPRNGELDFDVLLTPGEAGYGHCCYAYEEGVAYADASPSPAAPRAPEADAQASSGGFDGGSDGGDASTFEDLQGGLGPYDAEKRAKQLESNDGEDSPGIGFALLAMALLGLVAVVRYRN